MLKGRGRDPRGASSPAPGHFNMRPPALAQPRTPLPQRQPIKPEPDYEVVEFPSDQYVNAKLQPPPPPPPRPPTGHPAQAASCGLCGGGGARVRCAECGRRALCASCDDMYHRHPKRRHHQRQALSLSQLSEDRPPLPPKTAVAPVPPPRRHKMSASPKPPMQDLRHATLGHGSLPGLRPQPSPVFNQPQQMPPVHVQNKMAAPPGHIGSMPFLNTMPHQGVPMQPQMQTNTLGHFNSAWNRPRGSLQGFNMPQMPSGNETWESSEMAAAPQQGWGRPLRRGASVLELGGAGAGASCAGCAHCAPVSWRYGSCASLDHPWAGGGWPASAPAPACCAPHHQHLPLPHPHHHAPQTPQPYRRAESRTMSRAASRCASPALSARSRTSCRNKHRTPSPPPLPSSDADSETEEEDPRPRRGSRSMIVTRENAPSTNITRENASTNVARRENASTNVTQENASTNVTRENTSSHGNVSTTPVTALSPPNGPWQCEHCTYVNEPGVRVCAVCCRTPTTAPQVVDIIAQVEGLDINSADALPTRVRESPRVEVVEPKRTDPNKSNRERTSTGCGPSPPRERASGKATPRLVTPSREQNGGTSRHDMAVGPSPPRDVRNSKNVSTEAFRESNTVRVSPYRETKEIPVAPQRHSISVGPSPPRHSVSVGPSPPRHNISVGPSPSRHHISVGPSPPRDISRHNVSVGPSPPRESMSTGNFQKKSAGTSPPRDVAMAGRPSASITKTNVSNTGTSPPPQSISTQTYEEPSAVGGGAGSAARARRRLREDARRERSRSRHSLSSDTRESERSVRTVGGGWEWRERDVSPPSAAEWGRLARRASHLDLRRAARPHRRSSFYGSQAASPEPAPHTRAASVEALAGGARGLQLARLLADAERLGYDAAEVQVALEVSPEAPLEWLRTRWAGLAGAVRGAAARLAPHAPLSEREARAALARHRGAVWPAVTECVETLRSQTESGRVSSSALVRGRVWGSPAGAEAEAAPRARAEYSSDEHVREEWLDDYDRRERYSPLPDDEVVARTLHSLRARPVPDDSSLLRDLLADAAWGATDLAAGPHSTDLIQSENDFIDAYNALTRASPLPNIGKPLPEPGLAAVKTDHDYSRRDDKVRGGAVVDEIVNKTRKKEHTNKNQIVNTLKAPDPKINTHSKHEPKKAKIKILKSENSNIPDSQTPSIERNSTVINSVNITRENQRHDIKSPTIPLNSQQINQAEEKPSNLNDMVDNTQKLIQQMKDEINSDINSIDDGHAQTSQSEHESSSNDEREESSYSETEEETDNMTSDEKEISSEGEYEEEEIEENKSKNDVTFPNRTSSEDNEQFEEALDNLDNQIEDVKHANIEILDSIARSLQEEHVMTIEINDPKPESVNIIEEFNDPKSNTFDNSEYTHNNNKVNERNGHILKKEDTNNNLFVAVNSFDEIYAELSTSINKIKENQSELSPPTTAISVKESIPAEPKVLLTKHVITEFTLKTVTPTHPLITENRDPIFKAIIETTDETESEEDTEQQVEPETIQVETVDDKQLINGKSSSESSSSSNQSSPSHSDDNVVQALNATETDVTENIEVVIEEAIPAPTTNKIANDESFQIKQNTQRDSVEKVTEAPTNGSTNKSATVKSNIPKPVKTTQNIKAKVDKLTPKLIVSKVPIRRTSVKQYPAPAPPKTHFGNVQIGHVKQLQSKIFNNPKPAQPPVSVTIDVKPSTSTATLTKKKPAPPPPRKQPEEKQPTPPNSSPPKDKRNNYFRETCRTEDEWTDSESEDDSQSQIAKPKEEREEEPISPPSPPPPITLRRVSGQIIDLANVQLPEGSPERQARLLLAGGALETWEQARLAVELVARGAAPPAALLAALECADLPAALAYLHQDCELCATRLPEHEMVSMLRCTHRCCRECARLYFTVQVTERSIVDCVCPYCKLPELEALPEDAWLDYFAHLDILLKSLLNPEVHELFQRKLRDRTLARDPNFRWCMECSSGFFVHPKQKKLRCPECRSVSCATCRKPWSPNHEGLSCEQYTAWLEDNDPERSAAAVQQHLRENGLECPRCRFKYSLSRGGCMHFTCTQCKFEFCYGCGKPFMMGARCGLSEYCARLGLHAHHPRNCLFYLRDKEPHELQTLLQMNNVPYETKATDGGGRCPIQLQRETPAGLVDGVCGSEAPDNYAGLCKNHYLEYLSRVVRGRCVDPLPVLRVDDLETLVRRAALRPPPRPYGSLDGVYRRALTEVRPLVAGRTTSSTWPAWRATSTPSPSCRWASWSPSCAAARCRCPTADPGTPTPSTLGCAQRLSERKFLWTNFDGGNAYMVIKFLLGVTISENLV